MDIYDELVERRIREAQARAEFDDLPGAGAPLTLDDDRLVPEELRAAYRLLRNAGYAPPEVEAMRELADLERALPCSTPEEYQRLLARFDALLARTPFGRDRMPLAIEAAYLERVATKLARRAPR
jgi:hypothetical protein